MGIPLGIEMSYQPPIEARPIVPSFRRASTMPRGAYSGYRVIATNSLPNAFVAHASLCSWAAHRNGAGLCRKERKGFLESSAVTV